VFNELTPTCWQTIIINRQILKVKYFYWAATHQAKRFGAPRTQGIELLKAVYGVKK
jgi:hypothetical protein